MTLTIHGSPPLSISSPPHLPQKLLLELAIDICNKLNLVTSPPTDSHHSLPNSLPHPKISARAKNKASNRASDRYF